MKGNGTNPWNLFLEAVNTRRLYSLVFSSLPLRIGSS